MRAPPVLRARATHLYPGACGFAESPPPDGGCLLAFADGAAAPASLATAPDGARRLETGPHVTARGARIPPKHWLVAFEGPRWRVLRKLPAAARRG